MLGKEIKNKKFELFHGNSLEILKKMESNSVDHTITSPPYNMNLRVRNDKYVSRQIVKEMSSKYENFDDNLSMEEYYEFTKKTLIELLRITKNYVFYNVQFITGNKRALFKAIGDFSEYIKEIIIWDKKHGQPAIANGVMNSQYEIILVLTNNQKDSMQRMFKSSNFSRGTLSNHWTINRGKSKLEGHFATFPEALIEKIISNFTKEGEIILDPFAGTGTAGVVALRNKRKFIGIEIVSKYYEHSNNSLKKEAEKWT